MHLSRSLAKLDDIDWDYLGDQSDSPFASVHFHPGRFISQIPATLIGRLSNPGDVVLDPYCGSGTTLIEAQRLGRRAIGIDLNPTSVLICRAKLLRNRAIRIERLMRAHLRRLLERSFTYSDTCDASSLLVPPGVQLSKWFHPETAKQLVGLWSYICDQRGVGRALLDFSFSGILLQACSETRTWGYVCDNTRPLEHRYTNAIELFSTFVDKLLSAYTARDADLPKGTEFPLPQSRVFHGDAAAVLRGLPHDSVDLAISSPPYFGVVDYIKAQRLTMEWFGHDIEQFRRLETGARSKRHRIKAYSEYLSDIEATIAETARVLKKGGVLAFLVGQSARRANPLPDLVRVASDVGLDLEREFTRDIASGRRQAPSLTQETLYLFSRR